MKEAKRTPLGDRYMLTVREAAEYFGIGEHKLRNLLDKNPEKTCQCGMEIVSLFAAKGWKNILMIAIPFDDVILLLEIQ